MLLKCFCGQKYEAKEADIGRGWAKTCSKSCAAKKRTYGRPNAVSAVDGSVVKFGKKKKRNKPNDKRYSERQAERIQRAKDEGYYPFNSEDEMFAAMCDNPMEGR